MEKSLVSQIKGVEALPAKVYTTATDGEDIDSKHFQSLTFLIDCATFTSDVELKIEHADSDDPQSIVYEDTEDGDIIYPENLKLTAQGSKQVGYIGKKRYVRANFVSGSATLSVFGVLGHPTRVPTIGYLADHQFPKDV